MTKEFPPFAIFRGADATDFDTSGAMRAPKNGTFDAEAVQKLVEAGIMDGADNQLLFRGGGMTLARLWFKSGYPLPRHSHDCACLYYIIAGSLKIGVEELGAGDGFFVGTGVPYAYVAGEDGVELLEFRAATEFGINLLGMNAAWGAKALEQVRQRHPDWGTEIPPSKR